VLDFYQQYIPMRTRRHCGIHQVRDTGPGASPTWMADRRRILTCFTASLVVYWCGTRSRGVPQRSVRDT
jgi:hypothetical protein